MKKREGEIGERKRKREKERERMREREKNDNYMNLASSYT